MDHRVIAAAIAAVRSTAATATQQLVMVDVMIMTSIYYCSNLVVVYANVTTNHAINVPILIAIMHQQIMGIIIVMMSCLSDSQMLAVIANILGIPTNIIIIIITATA